VLLVGFQVFDYVLLLAQFGIEKLRIRFEFIGEAFLWLIQEFGFVGNSLQESVIDFSLNVIVVILSFIITIIIEHLFHISIHFSFLLIQVHDNVIILLFLFSVNGLDLLALLSKLSQFLDLWSQMSLNIFQFLFDLSYCFGDLLKSLILLVIKNFFLV
jgi:hypothetical protein